jgi:DNA-binding transcriptional MerR regulator
LRGELLRPAEAAARLGIAANTLRVYSARFAALLGEAAARPSAGAGGRPGHRLYSEGDLAVLARAHALVRGGATYERALDRLKGGAQAEARPPTDRSGRTGPGAADLQLTALQQAVEAWRTLAEERAREAEALRSRIAGLEAELAAARALPPSGSGAGQKGGEEITRRV